MVPTDPLTMQNKILGICRKVLIGSLIKIYELYKTYGELRSKHGLDINGKTVELRGGKNHNYEAGHRVPFLWRYPNGWLWM